MPQDDNTPLASPPHRRLRNLDLTAQLDALTSPPHRRLRNRIALTVPEDLTSPPHRRLRKIAAPVASG